MAFGGLTRMLFWQIAINSQMVGLEAQVCLEVVLMIANLQTLGAPISYTSIPATTAAAIGVLLIPTLGFVMDRWGQTRSSKAKILAFTTFIEVLGALTIMAANGLDLFFDLSSTSSTNIDNITTASSSISFSSRDAIDVYSSALPWDTNTSISITNHNTKPYTTTMPFSFNDTTIDYTDFNNLLNTTLSTLAEFVDNSTTTIGSKVLLLNRSSFSLPTHPTTGISRSQSTPSQSFNDAASSTTSQMNFPSADIVSSETSDRIPWTVYLAMVGYAMNDCGYDSSVCFLKTFVLDCTPAEHHASVIVKSILVSSIGGVLVAVLGSIDLGTTLTLGTYFDPNAALGCFMAALCASLTTIGFIVTMMTGFLWSPPSGGYEHFYDGKEHENKVPRVGGASEKERLALSTSDTLELVSSRQIRVTSSGHFHQGSTRRSPKYYKSTKIGATNNGGQISNGALADLSPSRKGGLLEFVRRQRKQILVNMIAFTLISSLYSYEVYCVNFVGEGIFGGDPSAPKGSDEYLAYLDGVTVGSRATLIYYVTFAITNLFQEKLLDLMGWKLELIIVIFIYSGLTLATALSLNLWVFYITTVTLGVFRAMAVTVPYILANQFSAEQNGGKSSGTAIAFVAAMLPAGFVVCSAIMGPLIEATGNAAACMYYSAAISFLGLIFVVLLRS